MADHVSVEISLLEDTAARLSMVAETISAVTAPAADASAVGESGLTDALSGFVGSWRQERERLTSAITHSQRVVSTAAEAYRLLDDAMAREADTAGGREAVR